jgi:glycogen synthase
VTASLDTSDLPAPGVPTRRGVCVFVQDLDALGGSERQARLLAEALALAGERVVVITSCGAGPLGKPRGPWRTHEGRLEIWRLPLSGFESLATLVAASGCDLIYAIGIMMGSFARRIGVVLGLPVVVKLAGMGAPGDISTLNKLPAPERERLRAELAETTLVCIGAAVEREAREAGFTRLVRIPNGVALAPAPAVRPAGPGPTLLYVGRLQHAKGADHLVEALADVPEAILLLAGEGPDRAALEARVGELGLSERVRFLGRRDDVAGLLRGATAFVLPSRSEGLSNALLEALASGAPVVASAIEPNREVLADARDENARDVAEGRSPWCEAAAGVLVTPENPVALAAGLRAVLAGASLRERLSLAGPPHVTQRYGIASVAARYRRLFASLPAGVPGWRSVPRFARARLATIRRILARR